MANDPLVLQRVLATIDGRPRPPSSGQICTMSRARGRIAANHTAALALGYTSELDPDHNFVKYTAALGTKTVKITQWFSVAARWFHVPEHPLTGPAPGYVSVAAPPIGVATEIIAVFGQSNADYAGSGRKRANGLTYAFGENSLFYPCADPMGNGTLGGGTDAGPWARLADRAIGKLALNGSPINRVVIGSRAIGGSPISYWAAADTFTIASTSSLTIGTGSKTFTVPSTHMYALADVVRLLSASSGNFMDGVITAFSGTSMTINVFGTSGTGTFADWGISPPGAGGGYSYMRAQLLNMVNHGLTPTKIVFAQGEADTSSPADWATAVRRITYWDAGFGSVITGIRSDPLFLTAPIYVTQTCMCNLRNTTTLGADLDGIIDRGPDSYTQKELGREAIRLAQVNRVNGTSIRAGADLDWITPEFRFDGCHLAERGLDEAARRYSIVMYGSE